MAQGDQRPKHQRHPSRILRLGQSGNTLSNGRGTTDKARTDDEATIKYIKRILCARSTRSDSAEDGVSNDTEAKPLEELLPPLTSSNEVDVQLYAIIAVILSQFVQTWYNRITPDQEFTAEIVQIIAHCTRGIEQRLRLVDLEEVLLDELPALAVAHIDAVEVAREACGFDRLRNDYRMIYLSIRPNEALTPLPNNPTTVSEQEDNEIAWSQLLVSRVLPLILPPEDLENPCLQVLVSEIFSEMIVHNAICGKATEPWLLWEGVTKVIYALKPDLIQQTLASETPSSINKLEQFGLLSSAAGKRIKDLRKGNPGRLDGVAQMFWTILHFTMVIWMLLRSLVTALMHASSIPARPTQSKTMTTDDRLQITAVAPVGRPNPQGPFFDGREKRPVVAMSIWTCFSRLTSLEKRMPWLFGFLSLLQWFSLTGLGKVCSTNSALDRLMSVRINQTLSRPDLLPRLLLAIRNAIFPDNALAPSRQTPTSAEAAEIKRVCAKTIVACIPRPVRSRYFATKDDNLMWQDVERTLELFEDSYINKHLVISAIDLLAVRLFPELSDESVES